jgi:hypothetical protein
LRRVCPNRVELASVRFICHLGRKLLGTVITERRENTLLA